MEFAFAKDLIDHSCAEPGFVGFVAIGSDELLSFKPCATVQRVREIESSYVLFLPDICVHAGKTITETLSFKYYLRKAVYMFGRKKWILALLASEVLSFVSVLRSYVER